MGGGSSFLSVQGHFSPGPNRRYGPIGNFLAGKNATANSESAATRWKMQFQFKPLQKMNTEEMEVIITYRLTGIDLTFPPDSGGKTRVPPFMQIE